MAAGDVSDAPWNHGWYFEFNANCYFVQVNFQQIQQVQFELDMLMGDQALQCKHCQRPTVPDSKHLGEIFEDKMTP